MVSDFPVIKSLEIAEFCANPYRVGHRIGHRYLTAPSRQNDEFQKAGSCYKTSCDLKKRYFICFTRTHTHA